MTAPDASLAEKIARALVDEQLAACVNLVPSVRSIYRWQGAVHDDAEVLCVIKTTRDAFARVRDRIIALHTYDVPEVIALAVDDGHAPYLAWLTAQVR